MDKLGWVVACGALIAFFAMRGIVEVKDTRLETAQDSIAVLTPIVEEHMSEALHLDTVLIQTTDTVRVIIERVREVAVQASDSVRAHSDSIGQVYLDTLLTAHADEIAAWKTLADARLEWGTTWRDVANVQSDIIAQHETINDALRAELGRQKRNNMIRQTALGLGVLGLTVALLK